MNQDRNLPVPGEFYRHFKNQIYQIVALASHSETGEPMVVYQAMYGAFQIWVRPLNMFLGEVDRGKYPDADQKYRFERVRPGNAETGTPWIFENGSEASAEGDSAGKETAPVMNPYLLDFLDALDSRDYDRKLTCLAKLSGRVTQKELDDIYMVLDMQPRDGDLDSQLRAVKSQLLLLKKFDGERLR